MEHGYHRTFPVLTINYRMLRVPSGGAVSVGGGCFSISQVLKLSQFIFLGNICIDSEFLQFLHVKICEDSWWKNWRFTSITKGVYHNNFSTFWVAHMLYRPCLPRLTTLVEPR